jgi:pimeloyl-ACP methyl ester carboxylesterase
MTTTVEPQQRTVDARGLTFHYTEWGDSDAPHMLMLHGMSSMSRIWDPVARALQDRYHIIALDQRGHGDTSWPEEGAYSGDDFVGDIEALVDLWGWDTFDIIGLSMGGMNSIAFAARHPDRIKHLVSIDIRPAISHEKRPGRELDKHIADHGHLELPDHESALKLARLTNQTTPDEAMKHRLQHLLKQLPNGKWQNKHDARVSYYWEPANLWDELPKVSAPVLIVRGGKSQVLQDKTIEDMLAAFPDAQAVTIEEAGHTVPEDRPEEFIAALERFLGSPGS